MALNYETLIRVVSKPPEQRTTTEINEFIFPWLKQSLKKKQGIFQKITDDVIQDICKTIILERRPSWDVVIHQGDPGDTFYIILQGSVNIYRFDEDGQKPDPLQFNTVTEFPKYDGDPDKREEIIAQTFGNFIVTLVNGFDFGERALITNEPRSATVMTISPTDLLVVDREVFSRTLKAAHEKELQEKTEFINRCPLFCSWSARLKRLVSLNLERGRYAYDSVLYKQGSRAEAVYFIWSGEIKLSMDPLLHWLQYPSLLPQSDLMRQRALELFLPVFQPVQSSNTHVPSISNSINHQQSAVIKRRHMTFAEAENERSQRIIQLALLNPGDIIGLESYVCDLSTHLNTARCASPCDLFYILKHNFLRLQKRHGTQGLVERLRSMVLLSLKVYPPRIMNLPLFTTLMKRQLASRIHDEHKQQHNHHHLVAHNKHSWLLHNNDSTQSYRHQSARATTPYTIGRVSSLGTKSNQQIERQSAHPRSLRNPATIQYVTNDHIRVEKIEDRLRQWHEQLGLDSKTQIRPLTRSNIGQMNVNDGINAAQYETLESQLDITVVTSNISGDDEKESIIDENLLLNTINSSKKPINLFSANISSHSTKANLPQIRIYSKQEQYEDLRAHLKRAWKTFNRRPIPSTY